MLQRTILVKMKSMTKATKFIIFFTIAVIFYYIYSVYSGYYRGVRVAESYKYARHVAAAAVDYFSRSLSYPSHINDLNLPDSDLSYVGSISIEESSGIISIYVAGDSLDEGVLVFTPKLANNGSVDYACHSKDVPIKYIPNDCLTKGKASAPASQSSPHRGG